MNMDVQLEYKPRGDGDDGIISASANGNVIYSDAGDIFDADFRASFVKVLCKKFRALDPDDLEDELLRLSRHLVPSGGTRAVLANITLAPLPEYAPFPVDAFPPVLAEFALKAAAAIGCDESFVALPLLSAVASAIGNTRRIQLKKSWSEPAVLWAMIIGESGERKSPAIEVATSPIHRRQATALEAHEFAMREYTAAQFHHEQAIKDWKKRKSQGNPPEEPVAPQPERFIGTDFTIEALIDRLQSAPRGILVATDEMAAWIAGFDKYRSGRGSDVARWLEVFGARPLIVDRKTGDQKTIYIPRAAVCVTGGIQPHILARYLSRDYFEAGLAARLLLAMPPRRIVTWTNDDIPTEISSKLDSLFDGLYGLSFAKDSHGRDVPLDMPLKRRAQAAWIEFYNQHAAELGQLSGDLAAAWSKLEGYAARLALVIHLVKTAGGTRRVKDANRIDAESIRAGVELARWFGREARRVYQVLRESDDDRDKRRLVDLIRRNGGTMTARDLSRAISSYHSVKLASDAFSALAEAGLGTWAPRNPSSKGGRPTFLFTLKDETAIVKTPRHVPENEGFDKEGFVERKRRGSRVRPC